MAQRERKDQGLHTEMDEIEQRLNVLKITYEKYFCGLERIEPVRERDSLKKAFRELNDGAIKNATQRFRYQQLKARIQSMELYWTRNMVLIERGTHPKMKFRADLKIAKAPALGADATMEPVLEPLLSSDQEEVLRRRRETIDREERALKLVYDKYMEARVKCGQPADMSFESVRAVLRQQIRQVKSTFNVENVKFRVLVEDGKAKLRAMPVQEKPPA